MSDEYLLVGAHFRPPAKQLLLGLPVATPLELRGEAENPYDSDAIRVELAAASLQELSPSVVEGIEAQLEGTGFSVEDLILTGAPIHLGYIAKTGGKPAIESGTHGNKELRLRLMAEGQELEGQRGQLGFTPDGKPTFVLSPGASQNV